MIRTEYKISSSNGADHLHLVSWMPGTAPRMILQISHGMAEHIERYEEFAEFLCGQEMGVVGHDHLGHGKTAASMQQLGYFAAKNGHIAVIRDLQRVTGWIHRKYPETPIFLFGHSMGSFFVRNSILNSTAGLEGVILSGTGFYEKKKLRAAQLLTQIIRILRGDFFRSSMLEYLVLGQNAAAFREEECKSWLSRTPGVQERYDADPCCGFCFTVSAFADFFRILYRLTEEKELEKIPADFPILLISGSRDPVGNFGRGVRQVDRQYQRSGKKRVECRLYPECRHELLQEPERGQVFLEILSWIEKIQRENEALLEARRKEQAAVRGRRNLEQRTPRKKRKKIKG